ncbi:MULTISPECIES: ABC transporter permease [Bacillus]|uniref:ABC-type uncharacterized transport system permease subunit n=1 Tax=Bacillus mycoides TaxID=1405 RepID=A0A3D9VAM2_BACMY|nr:MULTISPECIES: hypothetical protein [Bacillus]RBP24968.1 ABC-type uncharacterized transport system permease subunit [Bacillus sp. DB-2]REF38547.1 ABC-type uncharacterized transport system permease subunit [Bacillus mycoides]
MKKYIAYSKIGIKQQLVYKGDLWLNVFGMIIAFVLWIFFWKGLYQGKEQIDGISISQMITYMAISYAILIPQLHSMRMRHPFNEKIRNGNIVFDILRPGNFIRKLFFERIGTVLIFFFFIVLPIYSFVVFLSTGYIPEAKVFLSFLVATIISILVGFFININFCLLMMKYVETSGVWVLFNSLTFFLGGMPFPIWIYPEKIQYVIQLLPLKFLYYVPTSIFNGIISQEDVLSELVTGFIWIVVLYITNIILWRVMFKKLIIQGG